MSRYTIEELEMIFKEHHEKFLKQNKEILEKFKENSPDSEIPSHFLEDFSVSEALHVICKEINKLRLLLSNLSLD